MSYDFTTFDRNCDKECPQPLQGTLTGAIPPWLNGSLICNGPGLMKYGDQEFNHVFDGSAILQKFSIGEAGVTYTSKFLRSNAYLSNSESKQIVVSEFGTSGARTSKNVFQKLGEKFQFDKMFSDNAVVTLASYGGHWYATTEAPFLHRIDLSTLDTVEKVDLHKVLSANSQCPHPITLPDGTTINVFNGVGPMGPRYEIYRFPASAPAGEANVFSKPTKVGFCDTRWKLSPCHMHTFGLTDKHVLLPEQPMTVDVTAMVANTMRDKPLIDGMEWLKNKQVKFRIVSLETGKELKLKLRMEPFYYMHIANCYEEDDHIVADFVTYEGASLLYNFLLKKMREKGPALVSEIDEGKIKRVVIPLKFDEKASPDVNLVKLSYTTAKAHRQKDGSLLLTEQILHKSAYDNPVVHPSYERKPYKYFYGGSVKMSQNYGTVGKVDVMSATVKEYTADKDLYTSSHMFVPRPGGQNEDDGVVLIHCLHSERSRTTLKILDSATMEELASATFSLPSDAPRSLHSLYFSGVL